MISEIEVHNYLYVGKAKLCFIWLFNYSKSYQKFCDFFMFLDHLKIICGPIIFKNMHLPHTYIVYVTIASIVIVLKLDYFMKTNQ